jgi:nicotinamidase/pyrazinamidase
MEPIGGDEMVAYDPKTALVVVDVQNDFADPKGSLYVSGGERLIPAINAAVAAAATAGATIVYTQDWHPGSTPHFQKDGGIWPVHCVAGSWGAEFHPELEVRGDVVRKGVDGKDGYSGFSVRDPESGAEAGTELEPLLRQAGAEKVVIAGLATDYCVKETAIDAIERGFDTTVLIGAVAAVDLEPDDGLRAIKEMESAGARLE